MEITFTNTGPSSFSDYETIYRNLALAIFAFLKNESDYVIEVNIVSDAEIQAINKAYRGKDVPTDIISFAFLDHIETEITIKGDVPRLLGEIMISYETAKRQAKAYAHSLQREMKFLFTHGILHLLGYNHETEEQEKIMFALQEQILDQEKKR
ncbi:MAG: rRNA maturation RNase YbeY [Bacilli bacterium]|jgi:probable rRNA maturation factor|nr:rRNA maturation RNase YbeY [Bacilli bacterium]